VSVKFWSVLHAQVFAMNSRVLACIDIRWLRKQFVEMSPSYFEACGATIYFIKTPQKRVPERFIKHDSAYHWQEMEADMPEGDALEDL
jgi:hypothetical protein